MPSLIPSLSLYPQTAGQPTSLQVGRNFLVFFSICNVGSLGWIRLR